MFLRAKVYEIRNNFNISMISSITIVTNDLPLFKRWLRNNCMFITEKSSGRRAVSDGTYEYYITLLYQKYSQRQINRIVEKWKMYDHNPVLMSTKIKAWMSHNFGTFTTF